MTPLHCAARSGHEAVVDLLLEKEAPHSSKTKVGSYSVHQLHVSLVVLKNEIKALWVIVPSEQTFCCTWHGVVEQ